MEKVGSSFVERFYGHDGIDYAPGKFKYHRRLATEIEFTSSYSAPKKPCPQKTLRIRPKELKERVLKKIHPGRDGRQQIENTTQFPYSIHAQLDMEFDDGTYAGSGSLIGPHHILTCAHNVYDKDHKWWANKIVVHPGRNGDNAPFGMATVTKAYIFEEWQDKGAEEFDIALLLLDRSIGKFTGWGSVHCGGDESLANETFHITGYPSDKGFTQMWSMCYKLKQIYDQTFEYEIDTAPGQSGSAIWSDKFMQPTIIGVHTLGSNAMNFGVRITEEFFRTFIIGIVEETYKLRDLNKLSSIKHLAIEPNLPEIAFGKAKWARYVGDIGIEPPLPRNIQEILNSPCIFWPEKKVYETHLLMLIPNTIEGKPFHLVVLEELIQNQKEGFKTRYTTSTEDFIEDWGAQNQPSHWVLMTRDVIPLSRDKTYDEQVALVQSHALKSRIPYVLPTAAEAAIAIVLEYVQTGKRLYGDSPMTYTICQEKVDKNRWPVIIGNFSEDGLGVDFCWDDFGDMYGVGALQKF